MKKSLFWLKTVLNRLVLYRTEEEVDFSFGWFIAFVIIQTAIFMTLVYTTCYLLNRDYIHVQLTTAWPTYLLCFVAAHFVMSLFEHLFHRYVLHHVFWRWLAALRRKHTEHHSLTHVRELLTTADLDGRATVRNLYPIIEPGQINSATFPAWALMGFWGVFSLLIVPLQILMPQLPILTAGYLAVVFSFALYEVIHAVEHLDYDRYWKRWVERYRPIRQVYGFHLMHHSRVGVNQAIGGFFGLPIWDWIFGTYFIPKELPLPGARVHPTSQEPPKPCQLIRWLDQHVQVTEARFAELQKQAALTRHRSR